MGSGFRRGRTEQDGQELDKDDEGRSADDDQDFFDGIHNGE